MPKAQPAEQESAPSIPEPRPSGRPSPGSESEVNTPKSPSATRFWVVAAAVKGLCAGVGRAVADFILRQF
ncbi:hypothetical protein QFZ43_006431 [Streptomyces afghaniensis]|nr:hypothetical protein [Streptomyces afghaniensis]